MIESLRTTQIAFFRFATPCGVFRGSADKVQKVSVQGFMQEKILWNHLWEHRFYVPDPRVFPPPDDHFLTPTTENPWLGLPGSPVSTLLTKSEVKIAGFSPVFFFRVGPRPYFNHPDWRSLVNIGFIMSKTKLHSFNPFYVYIYMITKERECLSLYLPVHIQTTVETFFILLWY